MIHPQDIAPPTGPSQTRWRGPQASNRLDCETGVLLRTLLEPVFQQATSWGNLRRKLSGKGFGLRFHDGRLVLTDKASDERICSCKFLGHSLQSLSTKLGRARVMASTQGMGRGTLLA
ncbi:MULTISPECIES: hypothetical protein [unclassified Marinovum]